MTNEPTDREPRPDKGPPDAPGAGEGASGGAAGQGPRLHGDLLTTTLLAFLKSYNAYGYELTQRLVEAGLTNFDNGTVYRTLRQLEKSGMVSSFWDTSEQGPARRMYTITGAGEAFLVSWMGVMDAYQAVLRQAMAPWMPRTNQADSAGRETSEE